MYSDAQKRASTKYRAEAQASGKLVQLAMDVKPEEKAMIKAAAAAAGKSVKAYIIDLVERDQK